MPKKKILIVDDEIDLCETIKFNLEDAGYEVLTAYDGYSALGITRSEQPDLIVLDVMLPGKNGYEVSRFIKEDIEKGVYPKNIPIIILTARKLEDPRREEFVKTWSHADLHLYKPFEMEELIEIIGKILK